MDTTEQLEHAYEQQATAAKHFMDNYYEDGTECEDRLPLLLTDVYVSNNDIDLDYF